MWPNDIGASDPFKPRDKWGELADSYGNRVTTVVIPDASHALFPEQPEESGRCDHHLDRDVAAMTTMRLYVSPRSPFVREVLIALCELGLSGSVDLVPQVVRMDQPNETVLASNPLGKIPTLILEDGSAVCGTLPIIDELDRRAGGRLFPTARPERSWHLRHQALSHGLLDILVLWRNERDKPAERQTADWLANFEVKSARTLDALEATMVAVAAAEFGLAHASLAALVFYLDFRFAALDWRARRPLLAAWAAEIGERASVRQAAALCDAM